MSRGRRAWAARGAVLALVAGLNVLVGPALLGGPTAANAADPCGPTGNEIACENSKPGTPMAQWDDFNGAGAESIQGFATKMSVDAGETVQFKIATNARAYTIGIYRTGWYGGDGARRIATISPSATLPQKQPNCISDVTTELYDCGNWGVSASWTVPSTAVSGVYLAHLQRADTNESSHITFVVRDDDGASDLVVQTSDTTWQAYNTYGGSDFYQGGANGRAYKVSYNRPVSTRGHENGRDFYFGAEYPLVRFLERNGYDVSYISGLDTATRPGLLQSHKTYLSVGHDEYWTGLQRTNVEAARDAGVNLMFLSGNEMYWRSRLEPSIDGSNTANRTLVTYKETWANAKIDPSPQWTGTWRDPRFASPANGGGLPENAVTGTMYMVNNVDLAVTVSAEESKLRLWRNTSLTSLTAGTKRALAPHTVGYESNEDIDNGFRPAGLVKLSTTVGPTPQYVTEYGNKVQPGTTTHNLTMYRAPSGARVFSAGSVQWTWGLDEVHDSSWAPEPADVRMQQAQVNLLADFSAQPTTLMGRLVAATKTTDTTGPTTSISTPAADATRSNGVSYTVTGTATDAAGRVAGVEVSVDDGATWHPATGRASWTYTYVQKGRRAVSIRARATDDSGNIGAVVQRSIDVTCPCSIFGATVPAVPATTDTGAVELGLRFSPDVDGFVSGVRFYKGTGNGGTHQGSLWSSTGTKLATVRFTGETATGWQTASFSSAVAVTAGTTYVVSYTAPQGRYAHENLAFASSGINASPLNVAGGWGAQPAGVYAAPGAFPQSSYQLAHYYVDALFTTVDESPLTVATQSPLASSSSVPTATTVVATFSKPAVANRTITVRTPTGSAVAGTTVYDATTRRITFTPTSALGFDTVHTVTVTGTDAGGRTVSAGGTWTFRTSRAPSSPGVCPCSLFQDTDRPAVVKVDDALAVSLGVRFAPTVDGRITGIRFFKGPDNIGTHTGTLWSATGQVLATGTFTGESSTGWQTLTLSSPVSVSKNTEYVASYRAPQGYYSATAGAFSGSNLSQPPLQVDSDSGAYNYGTGFPSARVSTNYSVDVVFERLAATIAITARSPEPGATGVPRSSSVSVWTSANVAPGWSMTLAQGSTAIAGQAAKQADGSLRFTPRDLLPRNADITVTLSGVVSDEGAVLPTTTWTFRTADADAGSLGQTLFGDAQPAIPVVDDSAALELGTAFVPSTGGTVTAVRFFKGSAANGGTHTGSIWSASGARLATVTFAGETPSGWQEAQLSTPLAVTAGTTYVVSYYAPQGHYSATSGFFGQAWVAGGLTAPAGDNGRFAYSAGGGFPTGSLGSTNYFVDVRFVPTAP